MVRVCVEDEAGPRVVADDRLAVLIRVHDHAIRTRRERDRAAVGIEAVVETAASAGRDRIPVVVDAVREEPGEVVAGGRTVDPGGGRRSRRRRNVGLVERRVEVVRRRRAREVTAVDDVLLSLDERAGGAGQVHVDPGRRHRSVAGVHEAAAARRRDAVAEQRLQRPERIERATRDRRVAPDGREALPLERPVERRAVVDRVEVRAQAGLVRAARRVLAPAQDRVVRPTIERLPGIPRQRVMDVPAAPRVAVAVVDEVVVNGEVLSQPRPVVRKRDGVVRRHPGEVVPERERPLDPDVDVAAVGGDERIEQVRRRPGRAEVTRDRGVELERVHVAEVHPHGEELVLERRRRHVRRRIDDELDDREARLLRDDVDRPAGVARLLAFARERERRPIGRRDAVVLELRLEERVAGPVLNDEPSRRKRASHRRTLHEPDLLAVPRQVRHVGRLRVPEEVGNTPRCRAAGQGECRHCPSERREKNCLATH